jgi:hypothetical protein
VVRLWEDVILLTLAVLEPVPEDLLAFIASEPESWKLNVLEYVRVADDDADPHAPDHPVVAAGLWHGDHYLDMIHLGNPARLRFWRTVRGDRDEMTLARHFDRSPKTDWDAIRQGAAQLLGGRTCQSR